MITKKQREPTKPTKTCLNRFLGRCVGCKRDYDTSHHPNNLDCKDYKLISILYFTIKDSDDYVTKA